jgi:hypothetical protein
MLLFLGKFQSMLETQTKYAVCDIFVINKHDWGNILSFDIRQGLPAHISSSFSVANLKR